MHLQLLSGYLLRNNNTKAPILERYPIPFTYTSEGVNAFERKHITTIETELTNAYFQYDKYKFTVLKDTASKESIAIMKMSDYNATATIKASKNHSRFFTSLYYFSLFTSVIKLVSNPFAKSEHNYTWL